MTPTPSRPDETEEQRQKRLKRLRRWAYLRETGRPARVLPHEYAEARQRVQTLHARGMGYRDMQMQCGAPRMTINHIGNGTFKSMNRATYLRIMTLRYREPVETRGGEMSPVGTSRRLRALYAEGFPSSHISRLMGSLPENRDHDEQVRNLIKERQKYTHHVYAERVKVIYEKYAGTDPRESAGVTPHGYKCALTYSAREGCAPSWCWDEDTIDDPAAIPEWTGECGTYDGYLIHRREDIKICKPCYRAYADRDMCASNATYSHTEIVEHLRNGLRPAEVAAEMGCNQRTVYYVRKTAQKHGEVFPTHPNRPKET